MTIIFLLKKGLADIDTVNIQFSAVSRLIHLELDDLVETHLFTKIYNDSAILYF